MDYIPVRRVNLFLFQVPLASSVIIIPSLNKWGTSTCLLLYWPRLKIGGVSCAVHFLCCSVLYPLWWWKWALVKMLYCSLCCTADIILSIMCKCCLCLPNLFENNHILSSAISWFYATNYLFFIFTTFSKKSIFLCFIISN